MAISIRYAYENKGPVRRPCEPAHKIHPEIAARPFHIVMENFWNSARSMPPRRTAETRPHQITIGRRQRHMAGPNASARRQKRACKHNRISAIGCPAFRQKINAQPSLRSVRTRFCQKTFCAIVFARGEYGRKWDAVPTSRSNLVASARPPVRRQNFCRNSLSHSLKPDVRCAPSRTGCAKGNDS